MKLFEDCEIARYLVRGHTAVVIAGPRKATAEELAALKAEYLHTFSARHEPMYFSADGWQAFAATARPARKTAAGTPAETGGGA